MRKNDAVTLRFGIAFLTLGGLVLVVALIGYHGFSAISHELIHIGWGLVAVSLIHLVPLFFTAMAWRSLLADIWPRPIGTFFWARIVREGVDNLLPVAQVGGAMVGARLLAVRGATATLAGASVVVDVTVEVVTQFLFTLIGLALLIVANGYGSTARWLALGLIIAALALLGFVLAQRWGMFKLLDRFMDSLAGHWSALSSGNTVNLHDTIIRLYRQPERLLASGTQHLASWMLGAAEVWVALRFMGHPVGLREALLLESLGQAIRSAAFLVPAGLGVQEGGYMLLGGLLGLSQEAGLALSLVKRVRDLLLGVPPLLIWQIREGHRLWGRMKRTSENETA